ncbi:hypothetical protein V6N11_070916 [Hibiscus sabdariffa]|uniref:Uncharacterized protein n=1 Tax=Hibiscus sabdariffa TaxID=183260 RepID=A0ABR2A3F1_9ROSI
METNSSVTVRGAEAPSAYHMVPRVENADQIAGGLLAVDIPPVSAGLTGSTEKKKRGSLSGLRKLKELEVDLVVVGSFLPGSQHDQQSKKLRDESVPDAALLNPNTVDEPASNEDCVGVQFE